MDKERTQLKAKFLYLISLVEDKDQDSVIEVLESTEDLLPDGKLKDKIQKALRRRKKYYDKADNAISDILDTPLNDNDRKIILDCLLRIRKIIEKSQTTLWDQIMEWFNNATGKN
ncbi:MAG: hypothetical protein PHT30_04955 [Bacilli bacterium]|nr:hypothetical protein [Bacilli bacterium]